MRNHIQPVLTVHETLAGQEMTTRSADRIARAFDFTGEAARLEWDGIAAGLQHAGAATNWRLERSERSVLGRPPGQARASRGAEKSPPER